MLETLLASARAGESSGAGASDAREAAGRAARRLRELPTAQGKTIDLVCAAAVMVAAEGDVVERILSPLLENAARFARRRVVLEVHAADGEVIFEVRDDGPGVAADERERIFEPGFRGGRAGRDAHPAADARPEADPGRGTDAHAGIDAHAGADALAGADAHAGAGLGLSLVRRLARASGGDVEARASSGGGSFIVRLPAG